MPHMNNLDLAVFPCMSKRHGDFLRGHHGNSIADPDEVWKAAKQVWDDLPSATIARGYVLAYRRESGAEQRIQHLSPGS